MEVFGDLYVDLAGKPIDLLIGAIEQVGVDGWARDREVEQAISRRGGQQYCFRLEVDHALKSGLSAADVGLTHHHERDQAYVPNVVPNEKRELTRAEYNAVLDAFANELVAPACKRLGLAFSLSKTDVTLDDLVSPQTADALRRFSSAANKSTGASHPLDRKRWNEFLILHARQEGRLSEDLLYRWLTDNGWDEIHAHQLVGEFEDAQGLLRQAGVA